jgi:hypothetical protein
MNDRPQDPDVKFGGSIVDTPKGPSIQIPTGPTLDKPVDQPEEAKDVKEIQE